ncbi:MAG: 16S rRNA (cytosine(1402)-N(4))-methyltransferase [Ruminococcaceae bacterium]|nr:16S rRNA (cytosine(1402)-N(4))-methyltransferase [Oscillospiraceae bacterium]
MINLLEIEKNFLIPHIKKGGVAVDFTMGNGHDTLWLSEAMGENGKVYAFDIQPQALESSRKLLEANGAAPNYTLILDSHSNVLDYVKEKICIGMFNLGFLPGGDKSITTKRETTMIAIRAAIELLDADGALLIAVYPGHEEGTIEGELIEQELMTLNRRELCASKFKIVNSPTSPFFFLVERR